MTFQNHRLQGDERELINSYLGAFKRWIPSQFSGTTSSTTPTQVTKGKAKMKKIESKQMDIFSASLPPFKFTKPIKLIELFAGYGSQLLAFKYLGANAEHYKICEWAVPSIEAYNDIHVRDYTDYSKGLTVESVVNALIEKGVSFDYNQPATLEQIKRKPEEQLRRIYNNIVATSNLVDVTKTKGSDFYMNDRESYNVFMSYSSPCQDLSIAGKLMGMDEDSGTRSSMLWQVGRILNEMKEMNQLPDVLMMENVPQVMYEKNSVNFNKWLDVLDKLGYHSFYKILEATDFGIPQTRKRCFVISIPKGYSYEFPAGWPLNKKLKDLLEDDVDEKYYLSKGLIRCFLNEDTKGFPRCERFIRSFRQANNGISTTLKTMEGQRPTDTYVVPSVIRFPTDLKEIKEGFFKGDEAYGCAMRGREDGKQHIECNGEEVSNTITTVQKDSPVAVSKNGLEFELKNANKHLSETIEQNNFPIGETKNIDMYNRALTDNSSTLVLPNHAQQALWNGHRIRKLTPRECFRLMGVKDEDFDKIKDKLSQTWLYHLAGDSIVVNVLMAIFEMMF